jgi:hypothetical protein
VFCYGFGCNEEAENKHNQLPQHHRKSRSKPESLDMLACGGGSASAKLA